MKRFFLTPIAIMVWVGFCSGCVSLDVKPTSSVAGGAQREGIRYRLPFSQFKGVQIRRLTKCGPKPEIAIKLDSVSIVSSPDWTRQYVVDMHSLSSAMKTSALKIERYPNGQLKSINAEAEDRSAAVIGSAISTALKFVTPIPDPAAGGAMFGPQACTPEAAQSLVDAALLKDKLATVTAKIEEETADLNGLVEQVQLAGGKSDKSLRVKLVATSSALQKSRAEHVKIQKKLDEELKKITLSEEFLWPLAPTDFGPKPMPLPVDVATKWFAPPAIKMMSDLSCTQFWLDRTGPGIIETVSDKDDEAFQGIRYRESEPGAFVVTGSPVQSMAAPGIRCDSGRGKEEFRFPAEIHQIGRLMTLPFNNRMFQSNAISATWDEAGRLTMVSYGEKTAAAETVANLASTSVSAFRDAVSARRSEELQDLKARNDLLTARVTNAELMGKLSPPVDPNIEAIANFDADRRLSEAETAAINAELALNRARAELAGVQ